jgi:hypothetical protein
MKYLKKSPFLKKENNQRILVFEYYDDDNRAASITEGEYNTLLPYDDELRLANDIPEEIEKLVFETISDRAIEVRKEDYEDADIVVAVC